MPIKDHQWPALAAIGKIERIRQTAGKTTFESASSLLSAPLTPEHFNDVVRAIGAPKIGCTGGSTSS
jgi:hypothetical protein